ncbi:DUF2889 domain-containing protein [Magnetospirillum sp. SS-4]|uniref:DUF2889 domain-containing protein n=1 Tax=Magnetospirillum sp. SS-4 TaxID=2681465 RepID=UPI00137EAB05|nr:DUF2889 domain-containing protein [Magnetospirillum sp. SS-4]CAA7613795.1 conserved hypothetical protein [Magnetospirillum sp. SS-4]
MPLREPAPRQPIHTRTMTMDGYRRHDGLWDIEGKLVDVKAYDLEGLYRKHVPAGEPIHEILVIVTIDDDFTIHNVEATIDFSPFPMCGDIAPDFAELKGLGLGGGFMREIRARFGGVKGCTHIVDLLGAVATTAFQTIYPLLRRETGPGRPALIDSCHAFAADGEVVARQWPDHSSRSPISR